MKVLELRITENQVGKENIVTSAIRNSNRSQTEESLCKSTLPPLLPIRPPKKKYENKISTEKSSRRMSRCLPSPPSPQSVSLSVPTRKTATHKKYSKQVSKSVKSKLQLQLQSLVESKFHVINPSVIRELIQFFSGFESRFGISFLIMDVPLLFHLQLDDLAPIARQNFSVSSPDVDRPHVSSHRMDRFYASHLPVVPR